VTLPAIRWGVVYGVVLTTARALGEFGAVSVVSGRIEGQTQQLPLYVQDRFENFDATGAYTAAVVLALLALGTLLAMNLLARRSGRPRRARTARAGGTPTITTNRGPGGSAEATI
jgi:sulfate transport system permease protein